MIRGLYFVLATLNDVRIGCGCWIVCGFLMDVTNLPGRDVRLDGGVATLGLPICVVEVLVGCPSTCMMKGVCGFPFTIFG